MEGWLLPGRAIAQNLPFREIMRHAESPHYFFQLRQGGEGETPYEPTLVSFEPDATYRQDVELLRLMGDEAELYTYASEWREERAGTAIRILV